MPEALAPGAHVRVRAMSPPGHVRAPAYLRGRPGVVERTLGAHPDPERLAYGLPAPRVPLYRVRFRMADLWPDPERDGDTLDAELHAHWLEPL